ncbi:EF-hand domain-containing protein [Novosphingobium profundi]|uniref:EF-hand domain-containing protein n=1 Tax=Novosphingobium profundi TaxID=1774954 RepID=UPI001BD91E6E|nr:EF-hand domain-containing protein [Novosphingobium profundi]MBT0669867.1 EF-hand domain-containing protein [Novosphingobium profundi]
MSAKPNPLPFALLPLTAAFAVTIAAAFPTVPAAAQPSGFAGGEKALERLRAADTNHDGSISRAELIASRKANWQRMDRNKDGYFTKNDLPGMMQSRWDGDKLTALRTEFDADHDGRLSRKEFVEGPTLGFDIADSNHDGAVSKSEMDALAARIRARKG